MDDDISLDDIIAGKQIDTSEAVEPEVNDAPTGEEVDTPPVSNEQSKPPEGSVPFAALADERAKRQELQRQIEELRRKVETPAVPETPQEKVDFLDDPDKWMAQKEAAFEAKLTALERKHQAQRLADSEESVRERYADAEIKPDDAFSAFGEAVQQNPALAQEMLNARNPGEYAYNAGKRLLMLSGAGGDLETLIQQREQAAVEKALAALSSKKSEPLNVPESLTKITGAKVSSRKDDDDAFVPIDKLFVTKG